MTAPIARTEPKSMLLAYIFWFFLGTFGAHRMYVGKMRSGLGMLGLMIASALLLFIGIGFLGYLALGIWALVDAFLIPGWIRAANGGTAAAR